MKKSNIKGWQVNTKRPSNDESFLYDIEVNIDERRTGIVRDCTYKNNVFIQIDTKEEYSRFEIRGWKRKIEEDESVA